MNKPLCRETLTQINDLISELDVIRDMISSREAYRITNHLPPSIKEKAARSIDTELRAREEVIKQTLKEQYQVAKV